VLAYYGFVELKLSRFLKLLVLTLIIDMLPGLKNGQKISDKDPSSAIFMGDSEVSLLLLFFV